MAKFTIELNDVLVTMRNGASVLVELDKLPLHIATEIFRYGVGQKLRDSASQAASRAAETGEALDVIARNMMEDCRDKLYSGDWTARVESASADPETVALVRLVAAALDKAQKRDWNAMTGSEQIAKANEYREAFAGQIPAELERMEAEKVRKAEENARKAELAKIVSIKL